MRSFKRYNKEQFRSEVAGIPCSGVESFDDLNMPFLLGTLFLSMLPIIMHLIKKLRMKRTIKLWIIKELKDVMAERLFV